MHDLKAFERCEREGSFVGMTWDTLIVALILAKEFILDFLGLGFVANIIVCCLIAIRVVTVQWKIPLFAYLAIAILPALVFQALLMGGVFDIAIKNIGRLLQVGVYGFYLLFLKTTQPGNLQALYNKGFALFNGILAVNIIVIVVQYNIPEALMAVSDGTQRMKEDAMSGLFGYGSTHSVALYTTFVIVYNIGVVHRRALDNRVLIPYTIGLSLLSLYVATLNDNKALFFFLPLGVLLCGVVHVFFSYRTSAVKVILTVPAVVFVLFFIDAMIPSVHTFFEDNILKSVNIIINAWDLRAYVNGSDERFKIIIYAASLQSSWGFGDGLGQADLYQTGYRGFNHFGQCDYGSIVILGGVGLFLFILYFYAKIIAAPSASARRKKPVLYGITFVLLLCASVYTQVFTQVRIAIPLLLLGYSLYAFWQDYSECATVGCCSSDR